MFEKLKDMGKMIKEASKMKSKMKEVQKKLKSLTVIGQDKSGLIDISFTGDIECRTVEIKAPLPDKQKRALEKAILQAITDGINRAKTKASSELSEVSKGLDMPGLGA